MDRRADTRLGERVVGFTNRRGRIWPAHRILQSHGLGAGKSAHFEKARGFGQCEIFLLKGQPGKYEGEVYNTFPLNDCPPAKFDLIDAKQVAKKSGWDVAWKNPIRGSNASPTTCS